MSGDNFPRTSTKASLYIDDGGELDRWITALTPARVQPLIVAHIVPAQKESVRLVKNAARRQAARHRGTGRMRSQIRTKGWGRGIRYIAGVKATGVGSNLIVGGVGRHTIGGAGGPVMPFWSGRGQMFNKSGSVKKGNGAGITGFSRVVEHPGFAADPFFDRAIDETQGQRDQLMQTAITGVVRDLAAHMEG
jgi:hypothetical protein